MTFGESLSDLFVQVTSVDFNDFFVNFKVGVVLRTSLCSHHDTSSDVKADRGSAPSSYFPGIIA